MGRINVTSQFFEEGSILQLRLDEHAFNQPF
jgi:hypothetical protein